MTDDNGSIEDRAANGEGVEPGEQIEAFPMGVLDGDRKTLSQVVKGSVEMTASLMSAEVPVAVGSGLFDPGKSIYLTVTAELQKVENVAVREDGVVVRWKQRNVLRPSYVQGAIGGSGAMEAEFAELVRQDPRLAGILLDRMQAALKDSLAEA